MFRMTMLIAVMAGMVCVCGCEAVDTLTDRAEDEIANASDSTGVDDTAIASATPSSGGDDISISSISWLGDNYSSASISARITGATLNDSVIATSYDAYSWPSTTVKVSVDAICCLFYERGGVVVGGKFDWWRTGGQALKGLENVHHGYNGHSFPASGTKTYTMIVSVNGSQRSNIKECSWR
jgi:hypothetical protein